MAHEQAPFGATSPILAVAKKHGVYWGDALMIADNLLRGAPLSRLLVDTYNQVIYKDFRNDIATVVEYWRPMFRA